jgi:hypothetical protein
MRKYGQMKAKNGSSEMRKGHVYTAGMSNAGLSFLWVGVKRAAHARKSRGQKGRVMITQMERERDGILRSFIDLGSSDPVPFFDRLEICKIESKGKRVKAKREK